MKEYRIISNKSAKALRVKGFDGFIKWSKKMGKLRIEHLNLKELRALKRRLTYVYEETCSEKSYMIAYEVLKSVEARIKEIDSYWVSQALWNYAGGSFYDLAIEAKNWTARDRGFFNDIKFREKHGIRAANIKA